MYNLFSCPTLFDYIMTINIYYFGNVHPNGTALSHDFGHKTVKQTYCDIKDKSRKTHLQNLHSDIHQPQLTEASNMNMAKP